MRLKKSLKRQWNNQEKAGVIASNKGQSILEYFILLAVLASLTIFATSTLFQTVRHDTEEFVNAAAAAMCPNPG